MWNTQADWHFRPNPHQSFHSQEESMKYAVEFIGTFFLMFVVALAAVFGQGGPLAGVAIGSILMVMIYAGGHISGGHYNPAVSTGVAVRGKSSYVDMAIYWGVQIVGALAAALLAAALYQGATEVTLLDLADPNRGGTIGAVIIEFLFTFALVWVVLNVATSKDTANNSYFGLAIGFTVAAGAYAGGFYSAGAFNPAVAVGLGKGEAALRPTERDESRSTARSPPGGG
jgi:aquaporin Z